MSLMHPVLLALLPLSPLAFFLVRLARRRMASWHRDWRIAVPRRADFQPWAAAGAVSLLILALARPVWDPRPLSTDASGQDLVVMVDVSNSMLTADLEQGQTRLDAVKQALGDLAPELSGDRVALVAFAGTTVVKCPLTTDLAFFSEAVSLLAPGATARGGTMLGDAVRQVKQDFIRPGKELAIWVFTDGGDQDSFALEAARDLAGSGTRLFIWGVGSLAGGRVPGKDISSVLNEGLLKDMAAALPEGAYWGAESPLWRLNQAYASHRRANATVTSSRVVWQEGAWWLLLPILALGAFSSPLGMPGRVSRLKRLLPARPLKEKP